MEIVEETSDVAQEGQCDHTQDSTIPHPSPAAMAGNLLPLSSISLAFTNHHLLLLKPSTNTNSGSNLSPFTSIKIPSQISHLANLSFSLCHPNPNSILPSKLSSRISHSSLQSPLSVFPSRPSEPSCSVAGRRCSIVWFRADLRVHDNEALTSASSESLSVLPVYLFDPRDYGKSKSGFDRTGPYRATFLLESVVDLRKSLRDRGSDLVVRLGRPEVVLPEIARAVGADAVYAHREVSHEEVRTEERVEKAMEEEGVELKFFWGSTLYHIEDLPFELEQMPVNYGGFRERVHGLKVRTTIDALDQMKGLPARGDVEPGEIPTLRDLGLTPPAQAQDGKPVSATLVGGEREALDRVRRFAAELQSQKYKENKDGPGDCIFGANFSCKISPWLAMGCLSPRHMFNELKKTASRSVLAPGKSKKHVGGGDDGTNWLIFELLWRDFFRFITKKYSSAKKALEFAPASASSTPCLAA